MTFYTETPLSTNTREYMIYLHLNKKFAGILTICIGLIFIGGKTAACDVLQDFDRAEGALSASLRIPSDHPLFSNLRRQAEGGAEIHHGRAREADQKPLLKQLKFGQGIKYPTPTKINPPAQVSKEDARKAAEQMLVDGLAQYKELAKLDPIPECQTPKTEYISIAELNQNIPKDLDVQTSIDYIFVTPSQADEAARLKEKASVKVYDYKAKDSGSYAIKMFNPPCLPFRIRQTSTQIFYHLGDDALIDY